MGQLLPPAWDVPAVFRQRLGDSVGRQRAMASAGHLLLVLHAPPSPGITERTGRFFWRTPAGEWKASVFGAGPQALKKHVAEFAERVDQLEKDWQGATTAADFYRLLQVISPLHRTVGHLHATLQQARELMPDERDLLNLRDRAGEVERAIDLLHQDARNGLDYTIAVQAERQARRGHEMKVAAHRLNLLVAVFFPIATLGTIFGMDLARGFDTAAQEMFWMVLGAGLLIGLILAVFITRPPADGAPPEPKPAKKLR